MIAFLYMLFGTLTVLVIDTNMRKEGVTPENAVVVMLVFWLWWLIAIVYIVGSIIIALKKVTTR